jgi:hypothetical protein
MYLKIRHAMRTDDGNNRIMWNIIQIAEREDLIYGWLPYNQEDVVLGDRIIFSNDKHDKWIKRILITRNDNIETIYCDDDVYLCNSNGQTIEKV